MIVAIIQARLNSKRLPGKILMDIEGKPMLQRVIERVKESTLIDKVAIAVPIVDKRLISLTIDRCGFFGYIGNENNVLDRYYQTANYYAANTIVRITSDCPLIDPKIVDRTIQYYLDNSYDYVSNTGTYPDGLDTEVFSYEVLKKAWEETTDDYDREHVVPYIIRNSKVGKLESGQDFSKYHWSVDTKEDLEFVRWVYRELGEKFHLEDIVKLLRSER